MPDDCKLPRIIIPLPRDLLDRVDEHRFQPDCLARRSDPTASGDGAYSQSKRPIQMKPLLIALCVVALLVAACSTNVQATIGVIAALLLTLFGLAVLIVIYFAPTLIARRRNLDEGTGLLFGLNVALGWTLLGWLFCLAWACFAKTRTEADFFRIAVKRMEDKTYTG